MKALDYINKSIVAVNLLYLPLLCLSDYFFKSIDVQYIVSICYVLGVVCIQLAKISFDQRGKITGERCDNNGECI